MTNKFKTCQGCEDRKAQPNCHTSCIGYITRSLKRAHYQNIRREIIDYDSYVYTIKCRLRKNKI